MLVCFWSPKGGSGTSVVAAATALVLARSMSTRLVDLDGDQPAVLGLSTDPTPGLRDWLRAGPTAPSEALEHLAVEVAPRLSLYPAGEVRTEDCALTPESGAALAVALGTGVFPTVCDLGRLEAPAMQAFAEVAGHRVVVLRGCYLALRRAMHHPALAGTFGAVLIDEHGRSLGARDVEDVLGIPVLATITARTATARAVDAGVLVSRVPESVSRPIQHALARTGWFDDECAA
jgi:hypothetical protein